MSEAPRDQNHVPSTLFESSTNPGTTIPGQIDQNTGRILVESSAGSGDVVGPASATDNAVVRFDGTTGKLIQNSVVIIADTTGNISGMQKVTVGTGAATGSIELIGSTSGTVTIKVVDAAGTYTLTLPTTDGNANEFLQTDGSGVLAWAVPAGSGANTALSNLASVSINTSLLAQTGVDLGSTTKPFRDLFLWGNGTFATTYLRLTGTPTSTRVLTIPDATDTFGLLAAAQAFTNKTYNGLTVTSSTGTLTIAAAKVVTVSNTLTFTGTDGSSVAFGAGGTVLYTTSTIPLTVGTTTIASGTNTRILYDNSGVLGEMTTTGSGTVVALATAPTFVTSITTPSVLATANGSGSIGASGTAFSNLFLASGAVINFAAGNVTLTHSSGILTQNAGELRITSANVGTNADSVPTLSSTSTMTNKTLTSPTIQTSPVLAAGTNIKFTLPADLTATGDITNEFNSGYSSTAIGDLVYLDSSATWQKAKADSTTTSTNLLGIALSVAASGAAVTVLLRGFIQAATPFPTLTVGAPVYISGATGGAVVVAAPTTTDFVIRVVGHAVHADKMWFNPSGDWITHT